MALTIEQSNKATSYDSYSGNDVSSITLEKLASKSTTTTSSKVETETVDLSDEAATKTVSYTAGSTLGSGASKILYGYANAQSASEQTNKLKLRTISSNSKIYRFIVYDKNGKQIVFDSSSKETLESLVKKYGAKNVVADIRTSTNTPVCFVDAKTLLNIEPKITNEKKSSKVKTEKLKNNSESNQSTEETTNSKKSKKSSSKLLENLIDTTTETLTKKTFLETGEKKIKKTKTIDNSGTSLINSGKIKTNSKSKIAVNSKYTTLQGCTETDKYYVCFLINNNTQSESTNMQVIDKKTGAVVLNTIIKPGFEHANGVTYDANTDTIYVANSGDKRTTISTFDLSDAIKNKKVSFKETKISNNKGDCTVGGIAIDSSTGTTYLASGDHFYMVNEDGTYTKVLKASTGVTQDVYAKDGYLYVVRDNNTNGVNNTNDLNKASNSIDIYKEGKYVGTKIVNSPKDSYELESLSYNESTNEFTLYYNDIGNGYNNAICTIPSSELKV